jgi:hypothetical protein
VTLSLLELLSVLLGPALLGIGLLRLQGVTPRTDRLAFLAWAWIQGSLGLSAILSLWMWCGAPLRAAWLVPVVLALATLAWIVGRRIVPESTPVPESQPVPESARAPRWERGLFAAALVFLLATTADRVLLAANDVLATSDEARIWAAKAKVMFHTGAFGPEFQAELREPEIVAHPDYPPLNPLLQLWVHAHAGEIVHVESRLPLQVFAFVLVLLSASAVRRRARPSVAALFLLCLGTLGRFYTYQVFSDALVAIALLACWDLWQRHQEDGARVWLRLLASTAPLCVWSKNEGLLQVLAFGAALGLAMLLGRVPRPGRGGLARAALLAAPLLVSALYLQGFNAHFGLVNDLVQGGAGPEGSTAPNASQTGGAPGFVGLVRAHAADNVGPILARFSHEVARQPDQTRQFLLLVLVLALCFPRAAFARARCVFTLGLVLALLGYMAVYLGTHWEVELHLKHSAHRLVFHLVPAAGLWVLLFVVEALPRLAARAARA